MENNTVNRLHPTTFQLSTAVVKSRSTCPLADFISSIDIGVSKRCQTKQRSGKLEIFPARSMKEQSQDKAERSILP
jgi:hypothetical protein